MGAVAKSANDATVLNDNALQNDTANVRTEMMFAIKATV
jgi:hypothetical protein